MELIDTLSSWAESAQESATALGFPIDWNPLHSPIWSTPTAPAPQMATVPGAAPSTNWTPFIVGGGVLLAVYLISRRRR